VKLWPPAVILGLVAALGVSTSRPAGAYIGRNEGPYPDFDCSVGFGALVSRLEAIPAMRNWGDDQSATRLLQDDGDLALYIVTNPRHPSHPAIIKRQVALHTEGVTFVTEACTYGDREAITDDIKSYAGLDDALAAEFQCYLCNKQHWSPSLERNNPPPLPD